MAEQDKQKTTIPYKFEGLISSKDIPRTGKSVIDNYSPAYDYIVDGDKIYYSKKGNDQWADISDKDIARKNLFTSKSCRSSLIFVGQLQNNFFPSNCW